MARAFRLWLTRDPINVALVLIGFYFVVTLVDLGCYFSFVARGGGGILSTFNPLRYLRYLLSPVGLLILVVFYSPVIVALVFPKAFRHFFHGREDRD
jgi:hypothetical protein